MDMEERVAMLEFQVELLFNNTSIDRLFFETKVTREQYKAILNLMDSFRTKIENGEDTHHYAFENAIYQAKRYAESKMCFHNTKIEL